MADTKKPELTKDELMKMDWGGTGLCPEAQADGVPCVILGRDCDTCAMALANRTKGDVADW